MARLAELQRQIDEASEEVRHLAQDEQHRRPQHQDLHQEGFPNEDDWYDNFHHGNFVFDDASPLSAELQATPWPPSYKPPPSHIINTNAQQLRNPFDFPILLSGNFGELRSNHFHSGIDFKTQGRCV